MSAVIEVENLSKKYIINHQNQERYHTFRETMTNSVKNLGRKIINPKAAIIQNREEFWALNDVSFAINEGDRVGIIGRNGAGKSTLLKVLSRITEPTKGRIRIKGRVASLLEVGTGFHPELTGRENVFLNGAILGMSKVEIQKKFDEIVAFAEVEKFLDTPVKRYSSGMYVRLAFAVAAHLEPEILIVDEVLAVGDAQFQKKCLGRMSQIGNEGRTVLFVSHNLGAIKTLCSYGIYLKNGRIVESGGITNVIQCYLIASEEQHKGTVCFEDNSQNEVFIKQISITNGTEPLPIIPFLEPFYIEISIIAQHEIDDVIVGIGITNNTGDLISTFHSIELGNDNENYYKKLTVLHKGINKFIVKLKPNHLRPGFYFLSCGIFNRKLRKHYDHQDNNLMFEVSNYNDMTYFDDSQFGLIIIRDLDWMRE